MTREEAIGILNETQVVYFAPNGKAKVQEALDMAISALQGGDAKMQSIAKTPDYMQQIPSKDGNDLISRSDAIEAMCNDCEGEHYPKCDQKQYCKEVKALLTLPSADAVGYETTATINEPISIQSNYVYVVRCKDCKHLEVTNTENTYAICLKHDIIFEPFEDSTKTNFCSWGERREP